MARKRTSTAVKPTAVISRPAITQDDLRYHVQQLDRYAKRMQLGSTPELAESIAVYMDHRQDDLGASPRSLIGLFNAPSPGGGTRDDLHGLIRQAINTVTEFRRIGKRHSTLVADVTATPRELGLRLAGIVDQLRDSVKEIVPEQKQASGKRRGRKELTPAQINTYRQIVGDWDRYAKDCKKKDIRPIVVDFCKENDEISASELERAKGYCRKHKLAGIK